MKSSSSITYLINTSLVVYLKCHCYIQDHLDLLLRSFLEILWFMFDIYDCDLLLISFFKECKICVHIQFCTNCPFVPAPFFTFLKFPQLFLVFLFSCLRNLFSECDIKTKPKVWGNRVILCLSYCSPMFLDNLYFLRSNFFHVFYFFHLHVASFSPDFLMIFTMKLSEFIVTQHLICFLRNWRSKYLAWSP